MHINEIATGTPDRALLPSDFSTHLSARRAMSAPTKRMRLSDVDGLAGDVRTIRHTAAASLPMGGSDPRSTQQLLRHAATATTPSYPHLFPERRRPAAAHVDPRS
jgi:site-specific recombinase XerD